MNSTFTKPFYASLLAIAMLASCSRPVAYFQRGPVDPSATASVQTSTMTTPTQRVIESTQTVAPANIIEYQSEANVRKDNKLATSTTLNRRMTQIGKMLASSTTTSGSYVTRAPHKMNGMERLILRKLNRQINKQLAPVIPKKRWLPKESWLVVLCC